MNEDLLHSLPTDTIMPQTYEMQIIDNMFAENKRNMLNILFVLKDPIIATLLFFVFSIPFLNNFMNRFYGENTLYTMILKAILFGFIFFVLTNIPLIKV
jgi:hypothetical protein